VAKQKALQAIRGMNDCLPSETNIWQMVETVLRRVASNYGFAEIRMPIVESTALFKRGIGEVTDIVEKEMYTFDDLNGDSLTLRPKVLLVVFVRATSMACYITKSSVFGIWDLCSAMKDPKKVVIVSFTNLA